MEFPYAARSNSMLLLKSTFSEIHISLPDQVRVGMCLRTKKERNAIVVLKLTWHEVHQQDEESPKPFVPGQEIGKRTDRNS